MTNYFSNNHYVSEIMNFGSTASIDFKVLQHILKIYQNGSMYLKMTLFYTDVS
jgi:hypothetical protein